MSPQGASQALCQRQALADDLERWSAGEPIVARPAGRLERAAKWAGRRPAAAALLAVSSLLVGVLLAAVPLHIARLRAKVEEARGDAVQAHLRAECTRRLVEGRDALARATSQDVQAASVLFSTVIEDIGDENAGANAALALLRDEARDLKQRTLELASQQAKQVRDRDLARQFLALRDEAFFELYRDQMAGLAASSVFRSRDLARRAMSIFPDRASLSIDEARALHRARQEVLFLLAEGTARRGRRNGLARSTGSTRPGRRRRLGPVQRVSTPRTLPGPARTRRGSSDERERSRRMQPTGALDWFLTGLDHWQAGVARSRPE